MAGLRFFIASEPARKDDTMHIAILTFEGFNELDSLIALGISSGVKRPGWRVSITSPSARVGSMNGVVLEASPVDAATSNGVTRLPASAAS